MKKRIEIKVSENHYKSIIEKSESHGFTSLTDYILFCCLNSKIQCRIGIPENKQTFEIDYAYQMLKEGKITEPEYSRIKSGLIAKLEKSSVKEPEL